MPHTSHHGTPGKVGTCYDGLAWVVNLIPLLHTVLNEISIHASSPEERWWMFLKEVQCAVFLYLISRAALESKVFEGAGPGSSVKISVAGEIQLHGARETVNH